MFWDLNFNYFLLFVTLLEKEGIGRSDLCSLFSSPFAHAAFIACPFFTIGVALFKDIEKKVINLRNRAIFLWFACAY